MIPDDEEGLIPPLTPGFALLLATTAGALQVSVMLMLAGLGFGGSGVWGMATIAAYGAVFAACVPRLPQPPALGLALLRPRPLIWWAVLALLGSLLLSSELDNIGKAILPLPDSILEGSAPPPFAPLLLVLVFVVPLAQELLFRGALQPAMTEQLGARRGIAYTAGLSSLTFALSSFSPWALLPGFANGVVLGILRHSSGSLYPALAMHALSGLVSVAASYQLFGIGGFDDTSVAHTSLAWLIPGAVLTGIGLRLCRTVAASPPPKLPSPSEPEPDTADS